MIRRRTGLARRPTRQITENAGAGCACGRSQLSGWATMEHSSKWSVGSLACVHRAGTDLPTTYSANPFVCVHSSSVAASLEVPRARRIRTQADQVGHSSSRELRAHGEVRVEVMPVHARSLTRVTLRTAPHRLRDPILLRDDPPPLASGRPDADRVKASWRWCRSCAVSERSRKSFRSTATDYTMMALAIGRLHVMKKIVALV